jgi:hypothetical protein
MAQKQSDAPMFRMEVAPETSFLSWLIQEIAAPLPLVGDRCSTKISFSCRVWPMDLVMPVALLVLGFCWDATQFSFRSACAEYLNSGWRERVGVRTDYLSDRAGHCLVAGHDFSWRRWGVL